MSRLIGIARAVGWIDCIGGALVKGLTNLIVINRCARWRDSRRSIATISFSILVYTITLVQHLRGSEDPTAGESGRITIVPKSIILRSLPFGAEGEAYLTKTFSVKTLVPGTQCTIDLSHAEGVVCQSQSENQGSTDFEIKVKIKEFTRNQPYGILIKKIIRVETNVPETPQLIIPIIGWTGDNRTNRDFNKFLFDGKQRWSGPWKTPNIAGAFLAIAGVFFVGLLIASMESKQEPKVRYTLILFFAAIAGCDLLFLAFTYSRGGWASFICGCGGLLVCSWLCKRSLKPTLSVVVVFVCVLLFMPSGVKRIQSYASMGQDLSIAHRILLWSGALQMMADHSTGVGAGEFGATFARDYQTPAHTESYTTAVSDFFTFGAERGVFVLGLVVGIGLFLVYRSCRQAIRYKNNCQMTLVSMLVAIGVSSLFSSLLADSAYEWGCTIVVGCAAMIVVVQFCRTHGTCKRVYIRVFNCVMYIVAATSVIESFALLSLLTSPTESRNVSVTSISGKTMMAVLHKPRWKNVKGLILYYREHLSDGNILSHSTLRPLAARGWQIVEMEESGERGFEMLTAETLYRLSPIHKPYLVGEGEGAQAAWQMASASRELGLTRGAGFDFLSKTTLNEMKSHGFVPPFLIFQCLYDDRESSNAAIIASKLKDLNLTKVVLSMNDANFFSVGRKEWVDALDTYLSGN